MLAEIHFLSIENLIRAAEEAARAVNSRFIPIARDASKEAARRDDASSPKRF